MIFRRLPSAIHAFLFVSACLAASQSALAQCVITPSTPVGVNSGGTYQFSQSGCGTGIAWTVSGDGSIDSTGLYSAPQSVVVHNVDRGCQVSPNNSPFNIPVDTLSVDSHSSRWLTRAAQYNPGQSLYHSLKFYPQTLGIYSNVVSSSSPQQLMHFYYTGNSNGYQDTNFPIPPERTLLMETGRSRDVFGTGDRHMLTMNNGTCEQTEIYNLYVDFRTVTFTAGNPTQILWTTNTIWPIPQNFQVTITGGTGLWAGANGTWRLTPTGSNMGTLPFNSSSWGTPNSGLKMYSGDGEIQCQNCNSQSGQKFRPDSYAQLGGTDAARMPIGALSLKNEEWYAATRAGRSDLGHALRTTISNLYLSGRYEWPAAGNALGGDAIIAATNGPNPTFTVSSSLNSGIFITLCDNYMWTVGCHFFINIRNLTGPWSAANGDQEAVMVNDTHFTVPALNSSTWGPLPSGGDLVPDFFPYGATVRLKASFNVDALCSSSDLNNWCPYAKVYLNTIKKYGMVIADGTTPSDDWHSGQIHTEFRPKVLTDASLNIRGWTALQPVENYLEVVNRSSQQLSTNLNYYQQSNVNRTYVCVSGSVGQACDDVLLQGTTIGTNHERLTVLAGTTYQLNVWVKGNDSVTLTYAIDSGITGATVSSGTGLLTIPNCSTKQRATVTVTSDDASALPLYIFVTCVPQSTDGGYRMAMGNYTGDYTDSVGNIWWGGWGDGGFNNFYEVPAVLVGSPMGTWEGNSSCMNDTWTGTDTQLYSRSINANPGLNGEDLPIELALPNGTYKLTIYGEPGFGGYDMVNHTCGNTAGVDVFDVVLQGNTVASWQDGYVLAGNQPYHGYNLVYTTSVSDYVLNLVFRQRVAAIYGISTSSLLIKRCAGIFCQ